MEKDQKYSWFILRPIKRPINLVATKSFGISGSIHCRIRKSEPAGSDFASEPCRLCKKNQSLQALARSLWIFIEILMTEKTEKTVKCGTERKAFEYVPDELFQNEDHRCVDH